jgi:ABC-type branched-subunit amino acid transport system ATPase component
MHPHWRAAARQAALVEPAQAALRQVGLADRLTLLVCARPIATDTREQLRKHPEGHAAYLGEEAH